MNRELWEVIRDAVRDSVGLTLTEADAREVEARVRAEMPPGTTLVSLTAEVG